MYTDKDYLVKERFHKETKREKSVCTLYRLPTFKQSSIDPGFYPSSLEGKPITRCPPGLENLYRISRVYLIKRMEMNQDDIFNDYKGELIDEQGQRIFMITSAAHYMSNEVIHYGKHKPIKIKGKVNYGALNHAGIQLFEIYGDPEKVIRVGPNGALWGEIQVIPGDIWNRATDCCCFRFGKNSGEAEIRILVLKKDNRAWVANDPQSNEVFKQVYSLKGKVSAGCRNQSQQNFLYKKTFDLNLYHADPFNIENESDDEDDEEEAEEKKPEKKPKRDDPIGRLCSQVLHEKLELHLPILEFPQDISVYDKLTLMGTFFLFNLKI